MLNALKEFQDQMTSTNDQIRAQATSQFRIYLDTALYNEDEATYLMEFFIHKLTDVNSIIDTSYILLTLSKKLKFIHPQIVEMIQNKKIIVSSFSREPRINFYQIFLNYEVTQKLASIILLSIIGEKDPRNILIVFQLIDKILQNQNIAQSYKDEIIQFLDCYYPIEFHENADKRFNIKKEEIVRLLDKCLFSQVLFQDSYLLLQDKLISPYIGAQGAALYSINWIINNQLFITNSQIEEIWQSILKLTETIIMDDNVIEQIPFTLIEISKKYEKIGKKIFDVATKTITEIPSTQQGYIFFNFLKYSIPYFKEKQIIKIIVQIILNKYDTTNINIAQKRLESLIQTIENYKNNQLLFINELEQQDIYQLINKLEDSLSIQVVNHFILVLKCLMEIIIFSNNYKDQLENKLFELIPQKSHLEQQCILDYFKKISINNKQKYLEFVQHWYNTNQFIFFYSVQCSIVNIDEYFSIYAIQHIFKENQQPTKEFIEPLLLYLESNEYDQIHKKQQTYNIYQFIIKIGIKLSYKNKYLREILIKISEIWGGFEMLQNITFKNILLLDDMY